MITKSKPLDAYSEAMLFRLVRFILARLPPLSYFRLSSTHLSPIAHDTGNHYSTIRNFKRSKHAQT